MTTNPVLDTVDTTFELILEGNDSVYDLDKYKELEEPYTVVSADTAVDNFDILTADIMRITCCGRQLIDFHQNFELKEDGLFKLIGQDYPDCEKLKKITVTNNK